MNAVDIMVDGFHSPSGMALLAWRIAACPTCRVSLRGFQILVLGHGNLSVSSLVSQRSRLPPTEGKELRISKNKLLCYSRRSVLLRLSPYGVSQVTDEEKARRKLR